MTAPANFHPAVAAWFSRTFSAPTPAQADAWPAIKSGKDVLIAAPTGSGKTLAAFLAAIDELVREGEQWGLPDETRIVYVSPLKALSNDIHRNLEAPLAGIREELRALTIRDVEIRTWVRTGDTPQYERTQMRRRPPHIVVTTPESLYILLGSQSGRDMLATTRTVIVDEIHAVAGSKRGSHLSISLERLEALAGRRLTRIGLSATQKPIEEVARFLVGTSRIDAAGNVDCTIVDSGHVRRRDLALELPDSPLEAVMSNEVWTQVYDRLAQLIREHRTTLVFVNTRRLAERVCRHLSERIDVVEGVDAQDPKASAKARASRPSLVAAHHGSLAKELRFDAEQRLKRGELKALVATASLELGIDIGDVDLVCQLSSPRSINAFLQRVGRSGHAVGATPKGRLFPLSRDDLVECTALLNSVRQGELDQLKIPQLPIDVLAQQIVAEVSARDCTESEMYELVRTAYPFRDLTRASFESIVHMVGEGFTTRRGRRGALLYHDSVNHMLRGRKGARLTAITSGGAIPDTADYQVMLEPEGHLVGTINEDFAVESLAGDVFQLGNSSYRIIRVERSTVRVEDARGEAPTIPFWLGEAPGRTDELSSAVSRLRTDVATLLDAHQAPQQSSPAVLDYFIDGVGISEAGAAQITDYLAAGHAALGCLPTQQTIVFERFFDEAGGMQLVIHSPFGSRINRAWGLALRKRFCRTFNFELQAAATEDTIVLSLTTAHSFELADVARYLHPNTAREILIQALLAAPMFTTRWRWDASISLALPRFRGGKKVPPPLARMNAEDLLAAVFPDQVACGENLTGDIVVPDHPLVQQTVRDCLEEAMDIEGFERLLRALISNEITVVARDLTEPSPLALEVLSARPYAYLDDAPLEERRTQAVMSRRWIDPESAADIGKLDPEAIARVRSEAWPDAATEDELHDALLWLRFLTEREVQREVAWPALLQELMKRNRVVRIGEQETGATEGALYIAAERQPLFRAVWPAIELNGPTIAGNDARQWSREEALREIVRGRLEGLGPATATALASSLGASINDVDAALIALEAEGSAMRGNFETATSTRRSAVPPPDCPLPNPPPLRGGGEEKSASLLQSPPPVAGGTEEKSASLLQSRPPVAGGTEEKSASLLQSPPPVAGGGLGRGRIDASAAALVLNSEHTLAIAAPVQWCDRRLLARIHRYTVKRLRAEIEPVQARDFLRFLFDWQRVTPASRMQGPDAVPAILAQLEGVDAPASAWETEVLPARIAEYEPAWLDEQCLAGRIVWTRLATRASDAERGAAPVRSTPIALLARRNVKLWSAFTDQTERTQLTAKAQQVAEFLQTHGASFFDEIVDSAGLLPNQVEEALAELVALGLVNSDSFGGLRALLVPADRRRPAARDTRRRRRIAIFGMQDAGRWTLVKRSTETVAGEAIEHVCRTLLRRWGVVFWKLLEREADWLPPWREMLMCLRRLEARGEIRGGRFVAGFSGEQFALPEAIAPLRDARRKPHDAQLLSLSAADPLNLVGILTPGGKLPSLTGNRVLYRDGMPLALYVGGEVRLLEQVEEKEQWQVRNALLRRQVPAPLADLA
jgi:ATP-dependent helicase Lhr and Lhr-like helicase